MGKRLEKLKSIKVRFDEAVREGADLGKPIWKVDSFPGEGSAHDLVKDKDLLPKSEQSERLRQVGAKVVEQAINTDSE